MIKKCQQLNVLREFLNLKVHFRHKYVKSLKKSVKIKLTINKNTKLKEKSKIYFFR